MSNNCYSICCEQYKTTFFNGFSHLQHDEEFVDLTLAADGHLIKVHKNIIAVASPYLKEMLKSFTCQSPVIFLNNVSHKVLQYIIEYVYQGEVNIPEELVADFLSVSKSLHITGTQGLALNEQTLETRKSPEMESTTNIAAHITINNTGNEHMEIQLCGPPKENTIIDEGNISLCNTTNTQNTNHISSIQLHTLDKTDTAEDIVLDNNLDSTNINADELRNMSQYSITTRGALQLILNRFIYCCQFTSGGGHKRRWRCIDYRRSSCPAFVDTKDTHIVARKGLHTHEYHDTKIYKKHQSGLIFHTVENAQEAFKLQE